MSLGIGSFLFYSQEIAKKCWRFEINMYLCTRNKLNIKTR